MLTMFRKIFILVQILNVLLFPNALNEGETVAPFKTQKEADIQVPKQDVVFDKISTPKTYKYLEALDRFLTYKVQSVNEAKEINQARGKTMLPSLNSVWDIANYLVGTGGSCFYVAQLFIEIYMGPGHRIANAYQVFDPVPGDVIYYVDGGIGYEHWAIYLGPDTALQGNYLGTTIIGPVYLRNATAPIFYRVP